METKCACSGSYRSSAFFPTVAHIPWDLFSGQIEVVRCPDKDEMVKIVLAEEDAGCRDDDEEEEKAEESHGAVWSSTTALQSLLQDGSLTTQEWLLGLTVSRSSKPSKNSTKDSSLSGLRLGTFLAGMSVAQYIVCMDVWMYVCTVFM